MDDALDVFAYVFGFWAFLFSRRYRAKALNRWREAGALKRSYFAVECLIATAVGLGVPLLIVWLVAT